MKDFGKVVQGLGLYVVIVLANMFLTGFIVWQLWTYFFPAADQPQYLSFVVGVFIARLLTGGALLPRWMDKGIEK